MPMCSEREGAEDEATALTLGSVLPSDLESGCVHEGETEESQNGCIDATLSAPHSACIHRISVFCCRAAGTLTDRPKGSESGGRDGSGP